jgi:general L-amino acid transport system permease protein
LNVVRPLPWERLQSIPKATGITDPDNALPSTKESDNFIPFWLDPAKRAVVYQLATLAVVGLMGYYLFSNTVTNLHRQSIATGFHFLEKEASFEIGESLIGYSAASSYARALFVGILNTIKVAVVGIVLTILLGTFVGIARLSSNWLVSRLASVYIEFFQDIPILLQLFFWYAVFYDSLPSPRKALEPVPGMFLCNRGLAFGIPVPHPAYGYAAIVFLAGCVAVYFLHGWARKRQERTGLAFPVFSSGTAILLGFPLITWLVMGAPAAMDMPRLSGFNFVGGVTVSPEFTALLLGLVLYTAAFVAEIVRSGIQAVS